MKSVDIDEAKTLLSALLSEIETTGEEIVLWRNGKPVARLTPYQAKDRLKPHPVMSRIEIHYDPTEPLDADEWAGER